MMLTLDLPGSFCKNSETGFPVEVAVYVYRGLTCVSATFMPCAWSSNRRETAGVPTCTQFNALPSGIDGDRFRGNMYHYVAVQQQPFRQAPTAREAPIQLHWEVRGHGFEASTAFCSVAKSLVEHVYQRTPQREKRREGK